MRILISAVLLCVFFQMADAQDWIKYHKSAYVAYGLGPKVGFVNGATLRISNDIFCDRTSRHPNKLGLDMDLGLSGYAYGVNSTSSEVIQNFMTGLMFNINAVVVHLFGTPLYFGGGLSVFTRNVFSNPEHIGAVDGGLMGKLGLDFLRINLVGNDVKPALRFFIELDHVSTVMLKHYTGASLGMRYYF